MNKFKVELIFESTGSPESDPSLVTEVVVESETQALSAAKAKLSESNPDLNFAKIWCWHIEKLS